MGFVASQFERTSRLLAPRAKTCPATRVAELERLPGHIRMTRSCKFLVPDNLVCKQCAKKRVGEYGIMAFSAVRVI